MSVGTFNELGKLALVDDSKRAAALALVAHQSGAVRFGNDPATSALDVDCRAHDVDNLYVVDPSLFPSSTAVNPALTAMASALRVGDHVLERLGARIEEPITAPRDDAQLVEVLS